MFFTPSLKGETSENQPPFWVRGKADFQFLEMPFIFIYFHSEPRKHIEKNRHLTPQTNLLLHHSQAKSNISNMKYSF